MTTFEPTGKLHVAHAGDILIISESSHTIERLGSVNVVLLDVSEEGRQALIDWLSQNEIDDIQKALGIGRGTSGRIKRSLGISEKYDRSSRSTRYRRKKHEHE